MNKYNYILSEKIDTLVANGITEFHDILKNCESADPRKVQELLKKKNIELIKNGSAESFLNSSIVGNTYLPAPDVSYSQWWFEESTVKYIVDKIRAKIRLAKGNQVVCIGTPTLALKTSESIPTILLDIDKDIISIFNDLKMEKCSGIQYNIATPLPKELKSSFDLALIDPPWYDNDLRSAINRAIESVKIECEVLFSYPGRLTRPGIEESRSKLIKDLISIGHDIISIEHDNLSYVVPFFEQNALKDIKEFKTIPWRRGDLIIFKKKTEELLDNPGKISGKIVKSYSRNPKEFRVFLNNKSSLSQGLPPSKIEDYSKNISTRASTTKPDLWTTSKIGLQISDHKLIGKILKLWEGGNSKEEVRSKLLRQNYSGDKLKATIEKLENYCGLWGVYSSPAVLKTPKEIIDQKESGLSNFAVVKNTRAIEEESDGFRPPFSRDRDRLVWSSGLRRLADKTQLFPSIEDDTVRRRLTHTLEVQQLALTIGTSLGLNLDLIEASALAHDIGHTPFGHAGEHAIDKLLKEIHPRLGGFNHYEHGLDVLTYIESPYASDPQKKFFGLNISNEVLEAVIKHTYYRDGNQFSSEVLIDNSKHQELIPGGYSHLEGQAVRIADKISYLISDIEDGLRLGAITIFDLIKCQLFHIPPLHFNIKSSENVLSQFLRQRKLLIKILMEDVITSSTLRISQNSIKSPDDCRKADLFIIDHSKEISQAVGEIWNNLQEKKLFTNRKVLNSNLLAAKIVSELVILFTIIPDLIEIDFKEDYQNLKESKYYRFYKDKLGDQISISANMLNFIPFHLLIGTKYPAYQEIKEIPLFDLIRSKDYVASLSDYKARKLHNMLLTNEIR
ncbi:dGTP triphosphohydrolase [Salinimicrobium sp. TH3]|uniref:dGTP triphosphohydrolase n=1 Tax=Salinimicrobium sp. TH3 TaxID=2997342 RepID=UPI0022749BB5|nr:dNTP triphosphohydrolase [Salinimicrobium sp. TH3]MCY2688577.1 dNTP triphosphohydrolase [Salinimicrobium sp. TH3]